MATQDVLKTGDTVLTWKGTGGTYGISMENRASNAAAQGAKGEIGEKHADEHTVEFVVESGGTAPAKGGSYELWWAASPHATAGSENPGGCDGTDSTYKAGEEDEWKVQLDYIGSLIVTNDASTIMRTFFKDVRFRFRYGMPVFVNKTDQTTETNHDEHYIRITPSKTQIQAPV